MTRKQNFEPPVIEPKQFSSLAEIEHGIGKLKTRVVELKKFQLRTCIVEKGNLPVGPIHFNDPEVASTTSAIKDTVLDIFGASSPQWKCFQHFQIWRGQKSIRMSDSHKQTCFENGIVYYIEQLQGEVNALEEKKAYLEQQIQEQNTMDTNHIADLSIDAQLNHNSECRWNEGKQRYEVIVVKVKEKGYGSTKEEAFTMMRKILRNQYFKRPELEDIEEHENYSKNTGKTQAAPVTYNIGIVNSGAISNVSSLNVQIDSSVKHLQTTFPDVADQISKLTAAINNSDQLSEHQKTEGLDYLNTIAAEAEKPPSNRLMHRVVNAIGDFKSLIVGIGSIHELWHTAEPIIKGLIPPC